MGCTLGAQKVAKAEAKKEGKPTKNKDKNGKSDSKQDLFNETSSKTGQECSLEKQGEGNLETEGSDTPKEEGAKTEACIDQGLDQKGDNENNSNHDCVVTSFGTPEASIDKPEDCSNDAQIQVITKEPEVDEEEQKKTLSKEACENNESKGETEHASCSEKSEDISTTECDEESKQESAVTKADTIPVAVIESEDSVETQALFDITKEVPLQSTQHDSGHNDVKTVEIIQENKTGESGENIVSTQVSTTESLDESKAQETEVYEIKSQEKSQVEASEDNKDEESPEVEIGEIKTDAIETSKNDIDITKEQPVESDEVNTLKETEMSRDYVFQGNTGTKTEDIAERIVGTQEDDLETTEEGPFEVLEENKEGKSDLNTVEIPEENKLVETEVGTIKTQENKIQETKEHHVVIQEENEIEETDQSTSETLHGSITEKANEIINEEAHESETESSQILRYNDDITSKSQHFEEKESLETQEESIPHVHNVEKEVKDTEGVQPSQEVAMIMEEPSADMQTPVFEDVKGDGEEEVTLEKKVTVQAPEEEVSQEKIQEVSPIKSTQKDSEDKGAFTDALERAGESSVDFVPQQFPPAAEDLRSEQESFVSVETENKQKERTAAPSIVSVEHNKVEIVSAENMTSSTNLQTVELPDESVQSMSSSHLDASNVETIEEKPDKISVAKVIESSVNPVPTPVPDTAEQESTEPQFGKTKNSSVEVRSSDDILPPLPPPQEEVTAESNNTEIVTDERNEHDSLPPPPPQIDDSIQTCEEEDEIVEQTDFPPPPQEDLTKELELQCKEESALAPGETACNEQSKKQSEIQAVAMESSVDSLPAPQEEIVPDIVEGSSPTENVGSSVDPEIPVPAQPLNEEISQKLIDTVESNEDTKPDSIPKAEHLAAHTAVEDKESQLPEEGYQQSQSLIQESDVQEITPGATHAQNVSQGIRKCTEVCDEDKEDEEMDESVINGKGLQEEDNPECHSIESDDNRECDDDIEADEVGDLEGDESTEQPQVPVNCEESTVTDNKQVVMSDSSGLSVVENSLENGNHAQKESLPSNPTEMEVAE